MAGFLRPSPGGSASGLFVPKPCRGTGCQRRSVHGLPQTLRRPWISCSTARRRRSR